MDQSDWFIQYANELDQAEAARKAGNEGMARVSARRASGIIIKGYLVRQGIYTSTPSAFERLEILIDLPYVTEQVKQVAVYFLLRVNPDYMLPVDVDLIAEARWLAQELLGQNLVKTDTTGFGE